MLRMTIVRWSVGLLLVSGMAHAQDQGSVSTARQIAIEGLKAYDDGNYQEAADKLGRAYAVVKVPTLGRDWARALAKLGKLVEASELYLEVTRLEATTGDKAGQEVAKQEAVEERRALVARIPKLVIEVRGADAKQVAVTLDGVAVHGALIGAERLVNPGSHQVVGKLGDRVVTEEARLAGAEVKTVTLVFGSASPAETAPGPTGASGSTAPPAGTREPAPGLEIDQPRSGSVQRTLGWATIGLGGAGLVFGGVTGLLAISKKSDLDAKGCAKNLCYDDQGSAVRSYNALRWMSTGGFAVGVAGLAGGALLILTSPPKSAATGAHLSPWVGPTSAGVAGRF
jgi:hypothetical protein